jgi:predicted ester cyclase
MRGVVSQQEEVSVKRIKRVRVKRVLAVSAMVSVIIVGCGPDHETMLETNKALVRGMQNEVWNRGNLEMLDQLFSDDFVRHFPIGPEIRGLDTFREHVINHRAAFPDWSERVQLIVAEGDLVAVYFTSSGTNDGSFQGNSPTGRRIDITEMTIFRIADNKIVEQWLIPDLLSLNQQLGLIPE